jgi:hypothetical protein
MKGSLIKVKTGYSHPDVSPYGVILEEITNIRAVAWGSCDMFRTFHVTFPEGVFRMMAYEFEVIDEEG